MPPDSPGGRQHDGAKDGAAGPCPDVRLRPVDPAALRVALARAGQAGPYFELRLDASPPAGPPPWTAVAELYDARAPQALAALVGAVRSRIGSDLRVAASLFFQGYAARLLSPVLATTAAARTVVDLPPEELRVRYVDGRPLEMWLPRTAGWSADGQGEEPTRALVELAYRVVVTGHLEPLIDALRHVVPVSRHLLRGNAASALAGAARVLGGEPARDLAERLLDHGVLREHGTWDDAGDFRRRSCCLYYRVPGGGTCGDCVLGPR